MCDQTTHPYPRLLKRLHYVLLYATLLKSDEEPTQETKEDYHMNSEYDVIDTEFDTAEYEYEYELYLIETNRAAQEDFLG